MPRLTINSNIASLNAQRNFADATKKLSESYTRISSGLRINKAVDDAAGLSISESLKADTRILNQGVRNLNDGVSLLNIAEGALNELSNIATRLRELATQSANGTLSNKQRLALDKEAQSLSKEYTRIARTTEFNGWKVFDSDFGKVSLAAGGGRNSMIDDGLGGGIGDGSFKTYLSYVDHALADRLSDVADVNGDGIQDIVTSNYGGGAASVFIGNGDGTFLSRTSYFTGGTPFEVRVGDFNGDGFKDLVAVDSGAGAVSVLLGNGNGSFKAMQSFAGSSSMYSVDIGDLNGDGVSDLVTTSLGENFTSVYIGNRDGTFSSRVSLLNNFGTFTVKIGDFNSDGNLDLVSPSATSSFVGVRLGRGDGSFSNELDYSTGGSVNGPSMIAVGDMNGDDIQDLVSVNVNDNTISVLRGLGDGSFAAGLTYASGAVPYDLKLADFNGDGIQDVVSSSIGGAGVNVFIGNGNGTLKASVSYLAPNSGAVLVGDFNQDGVSDIAVTHDSVGVLLGNSYDGVAALKSFSLRTKNEAKEAMVYLESTLTRLSKQRGHLGAFESRVDFAINTLQAAALNYFDANSRITDVDIAEESSMLTANQILQQSAASILAQANLQPRLVLKLLDGI